MTTTKIKIFECELITELEEVLNTFNIKNNVFATQTHVNVVHSKLICTAVVFYK